jgi:2Fe-2S ferredoxin
VPTIIYIDHEDKRYEIDVPVGKTIMEGAVDNAVPGVDGDCGGDCSCATCHVYIGKEFANILPPKGEVEEEMLDLAVEVNEDSRLGCRLKVDETYEGLVVHTPESQF